MNNVNLIGRLGADPDLRFTPAGKAVASLNLAVDDGWGENKKTAWIGVTLWGGTAELAGRALRKGDRAGITGRLTQEEWTDKEGKTQRKTKVTAESLHLIEPKLEAPQDTLPEGRRNSRGMPPAPPVVDDEDDGTIPF